MTVSHELTYIPVGKYIFQRISQINSTKSIFGVPGDFNLPLLEHLYDVPGLNWIGCCNELNAGYSADGYARINRLGVVVTTYGVGELSALNAISGAFAENSPVLSIVGTSSSKQKELNNINVHHLIPHKDTWKVQSDHYVYEKIVEPFSIITESLSHDELPFLQGKIDNVIETIYKESKPGYIFLPVDLADVLMPIDKSKPLSLRHVDQNPSQTRKIVDMILAKLYSKTFAVLGDSLFKNVAKELNEFLDSNSIHKFTTVMGKSIIDETDKHHYHGVFNGDISTAHTIEIMKQFDLILHLGYNFNESNNYKGTKAKDYVNDVIEIGKDFVQIDGVYYTSDDGVNGYVIFDSLLKDYVPSRLKTQLNLEYPEAESKPSQTFKPSSQITQASMIPIIENYLKPNDVLVCELCSFLFSIPDVSFPKGTQMINQNFYGSIGYALPATLGVSLAIRDSGLKSRVLLIEGDGSAQMTIQELASYVRYGITPTILLLNNQGYGVERIIMGENRNYNDGCPNWDWTGFLKVFGDVEGRSVNVTVDSNESLEGEINKDEDKLKFIEAKLGKLDVGWRFHYMVGKVNAKSC